MSASIRSDAPNLTGKRSSDVDLLNSVMCFTSNRIQAHILLLLSKVNPALRVKCVLVVVTLDQTKEPKIHITVTITIGQPIRRKRGREEKSSDRHAKRNSPVGVRPSHSHPPRPP